MHAPTCMNTLQHSTNQVRTAIMSVLGGAGGPIHTIKPAAAGAVQPLLAHLPCPIPAPGSSNPSLDMTVVISQAT